MRFLSMLTCGILGAALVGANLAHAKTDVELNISGLEYSMTSSKADLDDLTVRTESKDMLTVTPTFDLNVYADKMWIDFGLSTGADANSGTLQGGYEVSPQMYVGALLGYQQKDTEVTRKVTGVGGSKTTTKDKDDSLTIGPMVHYRAKTSASLFEANGALVHIDSKTKNDDGTTDSTTSIKLMALGVSGDYYVKLADRMFVGAGGSYIMSLSGDYSQDTGNTSLDGDYSFSQLKLKLLQFMLEF